MTLFLLPNLLGSQERNLLPPKVEEILPTLKGLIVESEKGGRQFQALFSIKPHLPMKLLNEHTPLKDIDEMLEPLLKNERWGVVSDCGMPCLADPGAALVLKAQMLNIKVEAIAGPSSILLALVLSGLSGQNFSFHGYLPKEEREKQHSLKAWETLSRKEGSTHIFMEPPYKNLSAFEVCRKVLNSNTLMSIAWNLTLSDQGVKTLPVRLWKEPPPIHKIPSLFLINSCY